VPFNTYLVLLQSIKNWLTACDPTRKKPLREAHNDRFCDELTACATVTGVVASFY